jgi:hypothetical protein
VDFVVVTVWDARDRLTNSVAEPLKCIVRVRFERDKVVEPTKDSDTLVDVVVDELPVVDDVDDGVTLFVGDRVAAVADEVHDGDEELLEEGVSEMVTECVTV